MARQIVVMGSGETSPTMVTPHQQILAALGKFDRLNFTILDTPFGFQENADDLTEKLIEFFSHSVGVTPKAISLRNT